MITENDYLYICISTEQNVINLYPIAYINKLIRLKDKGGKIYTYIISTNEAKSKWTPSLKVILPNVIEDDSFVFEAKNSIYEIARDLKSVLISKYNFETRFTVVFNYGGGLKPFALSPLLLTTFFKNQNLLLVYPNKQSNQMVITKIGANYWDGDMEVDEDKTDLEIIYSARQVFSTFTNNTFKLKHTYDINGKNTNLDLVSILEKLPNIYYDEDILNFIFTITNTSRVNNFYALNVGDFFDLLKDSNFANKVLQNITVENNNPSKKGVQKGYKIDKDFNIEAYSGSELKKGEYINIANNLKTQFFSIKNYILEEILLDFSELANDKLDKVYNLSKLSVKNNKIVYRNDLIPEIFSSVNTDLSILNSKITLKEDHYQLIRSHGSYFEYVCLKEITEWALKNPLTVNEIIFDSLFKGPSNRSGSQFDITIYTKNEDLYFIECKTYNFDRESFLSHFHRAKQIAGVFFKYIILLPPTPTIEPIQSKVEGVYQTLIDNFSQENGVILAQLCVPGKMPFSTLVDIKDVLYNIESSPKPPSP